MLNCSKTAVFLLILLAISCTPKKKEVKIEKNKSLFEKGLVVATIKGKKIEEASGLVTSCHKPRDVLDPQRQRCRCRAVPH